MATCFPYWASAIFTIEQEFEAAVTMGGAFTQTLCHNDWGFIRILIGA